MLGLTLYYMGGMESTRTCRWSSVTSQRMPQMSSFFMTLFLSAFYRSHWGHFLKKIFGNFENLKKNNFNVLWLQGKKIGKSQKIDFFFQNHTFSTWIWILHVLCFVLIYISYIFLKILKFSFFLLWNFHRYVTSFLQL